METVTTETTEEQQVNAPEQTYEQRRDARHERELRIWELAKSNADVRMLLWQRDSAHVRLNLLSIATDNGGPDVPWPGHNQDIWYRLRTLMHPSSMEAEYEKELASDAAKSNAGATVE